MPFASKVVLHCPDGTPDELDVLLNQLIADGVRYVGVVGPTCEQIEAQMDDVAIAHGSPETNFVLTASHPDEDLQEALELAESLSDEFGSEVQLVLVRGRHHA